ncbi:hypothetical protein B0I37DRAFT_102549 [Chaetomium sp. MPI-CAGE-AT-0009]|nr:hypothetical protein B0I37DRAFT_102549 [Chaetomium sp. MPI-CAGE-AT-0009]
MSDQGNPTSQLRPWIIEIGINTDKLSEADVGCQRHSHATTRYRHQTVRSHRAGSAPDLASLASFWPRTQASSLDRTPGIPLSRSGPEQDLSTATQTRGHPCDGARRSVQCHSHRLNRHTPFQCPQSCCPPNKAGIPTCRFGAGRTTTAPRRRAPRDPDASFLSLDATFSRGAHTQLAGRTPDFVFVGFSSLSFLGRSFPHFSPSKQSGTFRFNLLSWPREATCQLSAYTSTYPYTDIQTHAHLIRSTQTRKSDGRPDNTAAITQPSFRLQPPHPTIRFETTACSPTTGSLRFIYKTAESWNAIVSAPDPVTQSHEHGC